MTWVVERAGETLDGLIDGVNDEFVTSYSYVATSINIYHNGLQVLSSADNGYVLELPRTFRFKQPPQVGDTVAVEYKADGVKTGGGALGGIPELYLLNPLVPELQAHENVPDMGAGELEPVTTSRKNEPGVFSGNLKPKVIIGRG